MVSTLGVPHVLGEHAPSCEVAVQRIREWLSEGCQAIEAWGPLASGKTWAAVETCVSTRKATCFVVPTDEDVTYVCELLCGLDAEHVDVVDLEDYAQSLADQLVWPYEVTVLDLGTQPAPLPPRGQVLRFAEPLFPQPILGPRSIGWSKTRLVPSVAAVLDEGRYGGAGWCAPESLSGRGRPDLQVGVIRVGRYEECAVVGRHYAAASASEYGVGTEFAIVDRRTPVGDLMGQRPIVLILAYEKSDPLLLARFLTAAGSGVRVVAPEAASDPLLDSIQRRQDRLG